MSNIEDQLVDSSRIIADMAVRNIGDSQDLFDEAIRLMLVDKYPISMRSARVVQLVAEKHPNLLRPHVHTLISALTKSKVDGVKRCTLKVLAETPIYMSEEDFGELADICFNFAEDENEAIAIRAFAIDILLQVVKKYPEIKPELRAILESIIPFGSTGLKNKCKKILKTLK
jgi:hypothetical protein